MKLLAAFAAGTVAMFAAGLAALYAGLRWTP
jgi:hypothetical protein